MLLTNAEKFKTYFVKKHISLIYVPIKIMSILNNVLGIEKKTNFLMKDHLKKQQLNIMILKSILIILYLINFGHNQKTEMKNMKIYLGT